MSIRSTSRTTASPDGPPPPIGPCRCEDQPSGSIAHHLHRVSGSYESTLGELGLPNIVFHEQNVD